MKKIIALAVFCLLPFAACADGLGVSGKVGTLGVGADLTASLSDDTLTGRIGFNQFKFSKTSVQSTVTYNLDLKLQTFEALADWYPFQGTFRTTLGLMYNNNKMDMTGIPTSGSYTVNGVTYPASDVGSLNGNVTFNKIAPYLGIGWGNPVASGKGWGFVADIGVLFQGTPRVNLNAVCNPAIAGTPTCTQLQSDTQAEVNKTRFSLSNFNKYPVASAGLSYQF